MSIVIDKALHKPEPEWRTFFKKIDTKFKVIILITFIFLAVIVFVFAAMIMKSVREMEDVVMNNTDSFNPQGNTTDVLFGEPQNGSTPREMWDKMDDDRDIAPPELSG